MKEPITLDELVALLDEHSIDWRDGQGPVDPDRAIAVYDLDSLDTVEFQFVLEEKVGRELPEDLVTTEMTCRQLHEKLCQL